MALSDVRYSERNTIVDRGLRKRGTWSWCILLNLLLCLHCVVAKCLGVDITVESYPSGDINLEYPGNPLEILCITKNNTSSDLEVIMAGKVLPTTKFNDTAIRYYVEQPNIHKQTYYCHNKVTKKNCINRVLVDTKPRDVTDFKCRSSNLDYLKCAWSPNEMRSEVSYNLTFLVNNRSVRNCNTEREGKEWYCLWKIDTTPQYRQQLDMYEFNLTSCNIFGCISQFLPVNHSAVVKPDRPINLTVLEKYAHSVVLQWSLPTNIVDFLKCGVDHKIEYQIAKIDDPKVFRTVNAIALPAKNRTYRFVLKDLPYAYQKYEVRVYIKSKYANTDEDEDLWSNFSFVTFRTQSEIPHRPPDMPAGAFARSTYESERRIFVYWKQLEEYEECGANFTYRVQMTQDKETTTFFTDKNKSLSYVELKVATRALLISVKSWNNNGSSLNSSYLYIPPENQMIEGPTSFTNFAYENGTYELSWDAMDYRQIDNYTLFWCQFNSTQVCTGRVNFTTLIPSKKNHIIDLPRDYKYQFAISVNRGFQTSGMVWANCDISRVGESMHAFPAHLNIEPPNKTFVVLSWTMECKLRDGIISGYNITYCPIIETSNLCDSSVGYKSVYVSDPKQNRVNVTNLLPSKTYKFDLALNTTYGPKKIKNATRWLTTIEDTPTNPTNVTISEIKYNSMIISWNPPEKKNGNIKKYVIFNYDVPIYNDTLTSPTLTDVSRRHVNLTGLQGFTNYSLNIQACNTWCSILNPNDAILVRTRLGPPSELKEPSTSGKWNNGKVEWEPPREPAGPVNLYQLMRMKIKDNYTDGEVFNVTENFKSLTFCDGNHDTELYQVRAINFDEHAHYGALADRDSVVLPERAQRAPRLEYAGPWSKADRVTCNTRQTYYVTFYVMAVIGFSIVMVYSSIKIYKKYRKMEDIKPVLPNGLDLPEKDTKYTFNWTPSNKDEKTASSDEVLLLPNNKPVVAEIKQKDENCAASDHTDSTALSDSSREPVERENSISEEGSDSSFRLDNEAAKIDHKSDSQDQDETASSDAESSPGNSPFFGDQIFKKNPTTGYVLAAAPAAPAPGYVQAGAAAGGAAPVASPPSTASYVMAGLTPPLFTLGAPPPAPASLRPAVSSSGYVRPEDVQGNTFMNMPKLGLSPTKQFGPESLPPMPTLPPTSKQSCDSSYIQLQSLDSIPSLKSAPRATAPGGYVTAEAVMKLSPGARGAGAGRAAPPDDGAVLDPAMSPDAYCRFSWSANPANDNLNSLLREPAADSNN